MRSLVLTLLILVAVILEAEVPTRVCQASGVQGFGRVHLKHLC